ncbi:hypothetical protein V6N13_108867 [Hibiscus sabdariffa]|uniref:Uncharacterized protein n=1 Tax=Hibiscus sabdariffa TaxID=183260 RepID=A0ABR2FN15_9ROSI
MTLPSIFAPSLCVFAPVTTSSRVTLSDAQSSSTLRHLSTFYTWRNSQNVETFFHLPSTFLDKSFGKLQAPGMEELLGGNWGLLHELLFSQSQVDKLVQRLQEEHDALLKLNGDLQLEVTDVDKANSYLLDKLKVADDANLVNKAHLEKLKGEKEEHLARI